METTPGTSAPGGDAMRGAADAFKRMPTAEKILAASAALGLIAFFVGPEYGAPFDDLFEAWEPTGLFFGSALVVVLIATRLFGLKLVSDSLYTKLLVLLAIFPALGLVLDSLRHMGRFLQLAALVLMAYAGAKITTRESILKR